MVGLRLTRLALCTVVAVLGIAGIAAAQDDAPAQLPGSPEAVVFATGLVSADWGLEEQDVEDAVEGEHYSFKAYTDANPGDNNPGTATAANFIDTLRDGVGVLVFIGHASISRRHFGRVGGAIPVEGYGGNNARRIRNGALAREAGSFPNALVPCNLETEIPDPHGRYVINQHRYRVGLVYFICITGSAIRRYFHSDRTIVELSACNTNALRSDFPGAYFFGFNGKTTCALTSPTTETLWGRLAGTIDDGQNRTLQAAWDAQGFPSVFKYSPPPGGPDLSLSPAVTQTDPEDSDVIDESTAGSVTFDTDMDADVPADSVLVDDLGGQGQPCASLSDVHWVDPSDDGSDQIDFDLTPRDQGTITLTVLESAHAHLGDLPPGIGVSAAWGALDGNQGADNGVIPNFRPYTETIQCAILKVKGLDPDLTCSKLAVGCIDGPPAPEPCDEPPQNSEFEVSAAGLDPGASYDLTLGGTAHGVTESQPIGQITADGDGDVAGVVFTLPDIPAHDPWTLTATERGGDQTLTTTLETGEIDCVAMTAGDGEFQSEIAAVGLAPNSILTEIVDGETAGTVRADADGTAPSTEIDGTCEEGQVKVEMTGYWIDHGLFTDDATDDLNQYC